VAGLPLTSGPVSFFLALEQGGPFAAKAAIGTLVGLIGVAAFCVGYSVVAEKRSWSISLMAGLIAFFVASWLFRSLFSSVGLIFGLVCLWLAVALRLVPVTKQTSTTLRAPRWDLPVRMATATAMVLLLTGLARAIGPQLSGLLSPFPVFAGIMAVFSHRLNGAASARQLLRGVLVGSLAFASFFLIVALLVTNLQLVWTYAIASLVAVGINGFLLVILVQRT
jgi:hypothetical protein